MTVIKSAIKRIFENFKLPYITITPTFSICPQHGYLKGEHEYCPKCDELILLQRDASPRAIDPGPVVPSATEMPVLS